MQVNISLSQDSIAEINLLRELINYIKGGFISDIENMDSEKLRTIINRVDSTVKQTPLLAACLHKNEEVGMDLVKLLIDRGANPTYKDINQQTVLFYLARDGKFKIAEYLLENYTFNLNEDDFSRQTPIFYASRENRLNVLELLVNKGANVNHIDKNGQTCLFYAALQGHYDMCKLLIKMGVQIFRVDNDKKTALFFAKKGNKQSVIELLNSFKQKDKRSKQIQKIKEKDSSVVEKKKPKKQSQKADYVLIFTDQAGNVHELNEAEIEEFQKHNERLFQLMCNPEQLDLQPTPPEKKFEKIANKILNNLWKMPGAFIFHTPVDYKAHNLQDYLSIVKRPMDFGTIRTKLQNNAYENHSHFAEDVTLVFDNCILYNGPEHEYGKVALNLKKEFSSSFNQFFI